MRQCCICDYLAVDTYNGDRCRLGDFPLMDMRFKYEYELNRLNSCPGYCPLRRQEENANERTD